MWRLIARNKLSKGFAWSNLKRWSHHLILLSSFSHPNVFCVRIKLGIWLLLQQPKIFASNRRWSDRNSLSAFQLSDGRAVWQLHSSWNLARLFLKFRFELETQISVKISSAQSFMGVYFFLRIPYTIFLSITIFYIFWQSDFLYYFFVSPLYIGSSEYFRMLTKMLIVIKPDRPRIIFF